MCLFLAVLWVGLRSVVVAFPGHTHLLFNRVLILKTNYTRIDISTKLSNGSPIKVLPVIFVA